jgi:hypothetical protein
LRALEPETVVSLPATAPREERPVDNRPVREGDIVLRTEAADLADDRAPLCGTHKLLGSDRETPGAKGEELSCPCAGPGVARTELGGVCAELAGARAELGGHRAKLGGARVGLGEEREERRAQRKQLGRQREEPGGQHAELSELHETVSKEGE